MYIDCDMRPDGSDGLTKAQRAVLRYLLDRPEPPNTWRVIKDLMRHPQCPADVSAELLDATILVMSHPAFCHTPVLDLVGARDFEDGWLQAPMYRSVRLRMRGIVREQSIGTNWWSTDPLPVLVPVALLWGCASWKIEVSEDLPSSKSEQAERRLKCKCIHCLSTSRADVDSCIARYQKHANIDGVVQRLEKSALPIGCDGWRIKNALTGATAGGRLEFIASIARWYAPLPHGLFVAIQEDEGSADGVKITVTSVASIRLILTEVDKELAVLVDQPACGRHLGDEVNILSNVFSATPIALAEESAVAGLRLRSGLSDLSLSAEVCEKIPVVPLPVEAYEIMLAGQ